MCAQWASRVAPKRQNGCFAAFCPPGLVGVCVVAGPLWKESRFWLRGVAKVENPRRSRVGSVSFWPSHAAWESNFAKVTLKALAGGHVYFEGELLFFQARIDKKTFR